MLSCSIGTAVIDLSISELLISELLISELLISELLISELLIYWLVSYWVIDWDYSTNVIQFLRIKTLRQTRSIGFELERQYTEHIYRPWGVYALRFCGLVVMLFGWSSHSSQKYGGVWRMNERIVKNKIRFILKV
jgi:dolichol kinase